MELMRCLMLGENNLIIRGHTLSFRRKLNSGCWRQKTEPNDFKTDEWELCFLSLIDDYIMSYSNCRVWSDDGNQPFMNAIKYNTTSLLGLPNRNLWAKLQQWLKTEKQIQITLYYLCPNYHKQDVNCYRKLKK